VPTRELVQRGTDSPRHSDACSTSTVNRRRSRITDSDSAGASGRLVLVEESSLQVPSGSKERVTTFPIAVPGPYRD